MSNKNTLISREEMGQSFINSAKKLVDQDDLKGQDKADVLSLGEAMKESFLRSNLPVVDKSKG